MATIADLASVSSIAATDYFVVHQSGTDRKALATKLPLLAGDNTMSGTNTFSGEVDVRGHNASNQWSLDVSGTTSVTALANAVFQFSATAVFSGLVVVANSQDGQIAMFLCGGGNVDEVSDPGNVYSKTKDTASSNNLYYDSGSGEYRLQNKTGATRNYYIFGVRLRASS